MSFFFVPDPPARPRATTRMLFRPPVGFLAWQKLGEEKEGEKRKGKLKNKKCETVKSTLFDQLTFGFRFFRFQFSGYLITRFTAVGVYMCLF